MDSVYLFIRFVLRPVYGFFTRLPCFTVKSLSSTTFVLQSEYKINCSNWPLFEYKKIILLESAKYTLLDTSKAFNERKTKSTTLLEQFQH